MSTKNIDKNKELELEKKIFPILAINNSNLKPYMEFFDYYLENVTQKPLGILAGFFEVREYSEDSAYIVNFLNSVLKKEYYLNPKRNVSDSFDSSLHKINIALSEIANHGNVNWLGKIDSAICVFEKNTLHFTTTGNAKILLWRKDVLTDITENIPEESELHPLKTFTNVSSGRLEKDDKIVLASADILNLLSISDIQKSLSRLNNDKFKQFLKTAIGNELDIAGTVVVEITEKEELPKIESSLENEEGPEVLNAFSGNSFQKDSSKQGALQTLNFIEDNIYPEQNEYTDTKTGHIYIQGDDKDKTETNFWAENTQILNENLRNITHSFYLGFSKKISHISRKVPVLLLKIKNKLISIKDSYIQQRQARKISKAEDLPESNNENFAHFNENNSSDAIPSESFAEKIYSILFSMKFWIKKTKIILKSKIKSSSNLSFLSQKTLSLVPSFKRAGEYFSKLSKKQKISTIIIVLAIVIIPIFLQQFQIKNAQKNTIPIPEAPKVLSAEEIYSKETRIQFLDQVEKISSVNGGVEIFALEKGLFTISKNQIIFQENSNTTNYAWPTEHGEFLSATYMNDLDLIFILTKNKNIVEFSPKTKLFKKSSISLPENIDFGPISTYLTYLYIVDKKNNQIYRYPRAEGGFGEKVDWLKETIDISKATTMTIDENLYLGENNNILKFFSGKKVELNMEKSASEIVFDSIYSTPNDSNIFVLDRKNSRIITFSKEGFLLRQYHHESIGHAIDFSIDIKSNKAYILTDSEIDAIVL